MSRGSARVAESKSVGSFRPDIEGLRAFAVGLVVLDHLLGWPRGGFVGVDVFYVLSGFLITGLLLREHAKTGWVSFTAFYARRVRRILPAALLVLVVTVIVAYLVWYPAHANQTFLDALAATFFVENWHLIRVGADYLQADGPASPVQHYWSLSVEEQFYVVWPWLILGLLLITGRRVSRGRIRTPSSTLMVATIAAVIVVTFCWSVLSSARMPQAAYFDTFSRVWELAAGALLAVLAPRMRHIRVNLARALAWVGLSALIAGAFVISPEWAFPGPWAALPVLASVMIIVGGASGHSIVALDNPVSRYIGKISYSLYLWHWPVIVFILAVTPEPSPITFAVMVVVMFGLSVLSFHFVEDKIRRSSWLQPRANAPQRRKLQLVGAALVAVAIGALSIGQLRGPAVVADATTLPAPTHAAAATHDWTDVADLRTYVAVSSDSDAWPRPLSPELESVSAADKAPHMDDEKGCRNQVLSLAEPRICDRPGVGQLIAVIGDSVALSWLPAVEAAYPDAHVMGYGYASCPAVPAGLGIGEFTSACKDAQQRMLNWVADIAPDILFTSSAQSSITNLSSGATGQAALDEWSAAVSKFFTDTAPRAGTTVMLGNPPASASPAECVTRWTGPAACERPVSDLWTAKAEVESAATPPAGRFVDVLDWFCDSNGECPAYVDGVLIRFDGAHLTDLASRSYGSTLKAALTN